MSNNFRDYQEDTISINHNWFNAYNISWVVWTSLQQLFRQKVLLLCIRIHCSYDISSLQWDLLLREYGEARWYIEDIKDICDNFEVLCQKNLAANAGMPFIFPQPMRTKS